jgi:hypothetical protein
MRWAALAVGFLWFDQDDTNEGTVKLSHDDPAIRQGAEEELLRMGSQAGAALRKAAEPRPRSA